MQKRLLMIGLVVFVLVIFSSLLILDNAQGRSETQGEASVLAVQGQVKILRGPSWNVWAWKNLETGKELLDGDRIQVGPLSSVQLEFYNKSRVKVRENTLVIIGKSEYYTYEVNQQIQCSSIQVKSGEVWVQVEKALSKVLKFKVESPNTVAGVRGTIFTVKVTGQKTSVAVDDGMVEVGQRATGEKVLVPGGFQTEVMRKEKPIEPKVFEDNKRTELHEWAKEVEKSRQESSGNHTSDKDKSDDNDKSTKDQSGKESTDDKSSAEKPKDGKTKDDKTKDDKSKEDDGTKAGKPKTSESKSNDTESLNDSLRSNLAKDKIGAESGKKNQS